RNRLRSLLRPPLHRNDRARDRGRVARRSADRWLEAPRAGGSGNRLLRLVRGQCGVRLFWGLAAVDHAGAADATGGAARPNIHIADYTIPGSEFPPADGVSV